MFSNQRSGLGWRGDGRGTLQRANKVIKVWISTCRSCFQALNSQQVTVPCMISECDLASSNWITGLFFHQSTTQGTAEARARGPWASSTVHPSTPWCRTSSTRSSTPLCPGPRASPRITAPWVSWSLKRMARMCTRSLKTWSPPGAHVARPAPNILNIHHRWTLAICEILWPGSVISSV